MSWMLGSSRKRIAKKAIPGSQKDPHFAGTGGLLFQLPSSDPERKDEHLLPRLNMDYGKTNVKRLALDY